jgi:hypothetical protein
MLRRVFLLLIVLTSAAVVPAAAQERFPVLRRSGPNGWASLSVGLMQLQEMYDPPSNSAWDFGNIIQYRGTLERNLQRGMSVGLTLSYARAPLTYVGPDCSLCDAGADLWQALALFRIGSSGIVGFHQVIELEAGVTAFSSFRDQGRGVLAPEGIIDPTFNIGYGLGYSIAPNTQLTLVQQVGLIVHKSGDRPAGDESNMPRSYSTRIGLRVGLGGYR